MGSKSKRDPVKEFKIGAMRRMKGDCWLNHNTMFRGPFLNNKEWIAHTIGYDFGTFKLVSIVSHHDASLLGLIAKLKERIGEDGWKKYLRSKTERRSG